MTRASCDVVGERLLAVDVLLQLQRRQRGEGVRVLGGADDHGVELTGVVEHAPEVLERPCLRKHRCRAIEIALVHVAQRDDLLAGQTLELRAAAPTDPDQRDPQLLARLRACRIGRRRRAPQQRQPAEVRNVRRDVRGPWDMRPILARVTTRDKRMGRSHKGVKGEATRNKDQGYGAGQPCALSLAVLVSCLLTPL